MNTAQHSVETVGTMAAKATPPITVSLATVAGIQVSELLLWATLIYTVLLVVYKLYTIVHDVAEKRRIKAYRAAHQERRTGQPDERVLPVERRAERTQS